MEATGIAAFVAASIRPHEVESLDLYLSLLDEAATEHGPFYWTASYGNTYRQLASNTDWFVTSLVTNAEREGFGSKQIWRFASRISSEEIASLVRGHSSDEGRHSKMFVRLLELCFPGQIAKNTRSALYSLSPDTRSHSPFNEEIVPDYLSGESVLDEMIQINLVEVRSLVLQRLLRPMVMAYYGGSQRSNVQHILDRLLADECRHIEYSARCIQRLISSCGLDFARNCIVARQKDLNEITISEMDDRSYD